MYKCNQCQYSNFKYSREWKLEYIYCNRLKDRLNVSVYQHLKFCNYFMKRKD